jgi:2-aminoadipate transaminase
MTNWTLAARAAKMNPSAIREILKLTDKPGIISLAGGLPSPKAFPLQEFTAACNTVMARDGAAALQYATSEGFAPCARPWPTCCPGRWTRTRCSSPPARNRRSI